MKYRDLTIMSNKLEDAIWLNDLSSIKKLIANGADVNTTPRDRPVLILAIWQKRIVIIKELINAGADVNAKFLGMPALTWAAKNNLPEIVSLLITKGANINAVDKYDWTALKWAAELGRAEIKKILENKIGE